MEYSIILIPIIFVSVLLTLKIIKSPEFKQTTTETKGAVIRLSIGGFLGAVFLVSIYWLYLFLARRTPDKLNPYVATLPYIASVPIALAGFWLGSIVGLLKRRQKK